MGEQEIRVLFALRRTDAAVLLLADLSAADARTWYDEAVPRAPLC